MQSDGVLLRLGQSRHRDADRQHRLVFGCLAAWPITRIGKQLDKIADRAGPLVGSCDVLPLAGTSFNPEAWCPDCQFFKLRRTPKKRNPDEYRY